MQLTYNIHDVDSVEEDLRVRLSQFVESAVDSTPFHYIEIYQSLSSIYRNSKQFFKIIVAEDGDKVSGYFPFVVEKKYYRPNSLFSPHFSIPYGGPVCSGDPSTLNGLIKRLEKNYFRNYTIHTIPHFSLEDIFDSKYSSIYLETSILDLQEDKDTLWSKFNRNTKRNVKKAIKNEIKIVANRDDWNLDMYYEALKSTLEDTSSIISKKLLKGLISVFTTKNCIRIFDIISNDEYIGSGLVLLHRDTVYFWQSGIHRNHLDKSPNFLLVWKIIEWAASAGYTKLDFVRLDKERLPGIAKFKLAWGGKVCKYPLYYRKVGYLSLIKRYF